MSSIELPQGNRWRLSDSKHANRSTQRSKKRRSVFRILGAATALTQLNLPDDLATALIKSHELANRAIRIVVGGIDFDYARPASWRGPQDIYQEAGILNGNWAEVETAVSRVKSELIKANHAIRGGSPLTYDGIRSCAHDIALHFSKCVGRDVHVAYIGAGAHATDKASLAAIRNKLKRLEPIDGPILANAMMLEAVEAARRRSEPGVPSGNSGELVRQLSNDPLPSMKKPPREKILAKAAALYHISKGRLSEAAAKKHVKSRRMGRNVWVDLDSLEEWLNARRKPRKAKNLGKRTIIPTPLPVPTHPSPLTRWFKCKDCNRDFESEKADPTCPHCQRKNSKPLRKSLHRGSARSSATDD